MIDDQQSGRQQDRKAGDMGEMRIRLRHGLDESRRMSISPVSNTMNINYTYLLSAKTSTSSVRITVAL